MCGPARPDRMLILAGGANARMGPLSGTIYKAFLPIHGLSCVARHVLRAAAYGITQVDVVVDAEDPVLHLLAGSSPDGNSPGNGPTVSVRTCPGSPADKIRWWLGEREADDRALVVCGDTLAPVDLWSLWRGSLAGDYDSALAVVQARLPFGVVAVDGDRVERFNDNPVAELLVSTGHMVLGPQARKLFNDGFELEIVLEELAAREVLRACITAGPFAAVDSLGSLAAAHATLSAASALTAAPMSAGLSEQPLSGRGCEIGDAADA